jgi:RNA recognition motif-containing protein
MNSNNTLWMGDIFPWMTETFILDSFNKYEKKPSSIKLIKDKKTNKIKNYCFIIFPNIQKANDALFELNGKPIINTQLTFKLNWANYNSSFNKSVYVGNLKNEINDLELFNFFKKKYDSVHHANIITDNGISKGYGFVLFTNENEYLKCLNEMNGIIFHGNHIKVKEQKKKDDFELLNSINNSNVNNDLGNFNINSYTNNLNQNLSNLNNESFSLMNNINSLKFYPKNIKNIKNLNNINNTNYYNKNQYSFYNNLEILEDNLDEINLYKKIKQAIEKMKNHYNYNYMGDKSKLRSKYFFYI